MLWLAQHEGTLTLGSQTVNLLARGGTGGTQDAVAQCSSGTVAVGIHGRSGWHTDSIGLKCRYIHQNSSLGDEVSVAPVGGTGGSDPYNIECPLGQALVGLEGYTTSYVNGLGIQCAVPYMWLISSVSVTNSCEMVQVVALVSGTCMFKVERFWTSGVGDLSVGLVLRAR